jgi:DNA polymerase-1
MAALLADPSVGKIGYDIKETVKALHVSGIALGGVVGDPMLGDYLLVPEQRRELDDLSKRYLEHALEGHPGESAHVTLLLDEVLGPRLDASDVSRVYREIELPLLPILARMEIAGIGIDVRALADLSRELEVRLREKEVECHALAGETFNLGSTQQLAVILFEKLGLKGGKRTKTGWSTDADTLEKLVDQHPLPGAVLVWRELHKLRSTYVEALPAAVSKRDGRVHTTFRQAVAATGRLSSHAPNLQNIPIRTDEGRRIRRCFVAAPGHSFVSCDYSQIELRLLAHYCEQGPLVESFVHGEDIHRRTAAEIFGVAPALVTTEQRRAAKAINFGIVYGMGASRLANDLRIPRAEAQRYIEGYFARYPQVRAAMDAAMSRAREKGYAETLFGRRRPVPNLEASNPMDRAYAERIAINTPIQGSAADLIKLAMLAVDKAIVGTGARLLLQVHDELVLEVPDAEVDVVRARVREAMEGAAVLRVPLRVDSGVARSWDAAHG